jgi:hypothetical protein
LYQSGKSVWGSSFVFKDGSRFVLFGVEGKRNKKVKTLDLQDVRAPLYLLPTDFTPCEKKYTLRWYKIGNTQYLAGSWGGVGYLRDSFCFPGEDLIVVLQKVKQPDYPPEAFMGVKLVDFQRKRQQLLSRRDTTQPKDTLLADLITQPTINPNGDSSLAERKQDIQHILKIKDSLVHITLYDNAVVDDDTVTIFINKVPTIIRQRLTDKGQHFTVALNTRQGGITEIIMQAENLGSIPPNTALMVIEFGNKRYEARLSAGFDKHAVIVLTYEPEE